MKIISIDSSGLVASVAVTQEDKVLAEYNLNNKKTHSQTLLPMIDELKRVLDLDLNKIDAIAISKGPGSFTGLRIGSATAKGIALALEKPIIEISSLEAMAYQIFGTKDVICPMMDARRGQVYTALFENAEEGLGRIEKDMPVPVEEIIEKINELGRPVIFLGDGVPVYEEKIKNLIKVPYSFAPAFANRQRAAAMGILAADYFNKGLTIDPDMHRPEYLRLSQAERERMEKKSV